MTDAEGRTGLILHVQRLSTEDGPGIRSTVFFKQCPLACRWCHNPESISPRPELQWFPTCCIGCRSCEDACARACIRLTGEGLQIDRSRCDECGSCASACPSNALETLGRAVSADALVQELVRDRAYYESSGGGVTLSGGEPMAQPGFTAALLRALKDLGIATAVDTSGFASMDSFTRVLPDIDLLLYDLKTIDPDIHRAFTGQANEVVLRNLLQIRGMRHAHTHGPRLWIRTPLIPGATATEANLRAIGSFLAQYMDGMLERWELCAFNNMCRDKYLRLGITWAYAETPLMSRNELEALAGQARSSGIDPALVTVTGAARTENVE
ncbi:MAG: glycyl-radical enzyme activating protein [Spirochaetia bacterium]|jgi:pyruvate formate lyase activating enzyme